MPAELNPKLTRQLHQNLAKEECHICKRLFGEHSPEEFKAHALDDVTIELDIVEDPDKPRTGPCPNCEKPLNLQTDDELRTCREALKEWMLKERDNPNNNPA